MASKQQFQVKADKVDIQTLWVAFTKDLFEVTRHAVPDFFSEWKVLEGDEHGNICLGSRLEFTLGPVLPGVEPFVDRIVDFDEVNHLVSYHVIEGGLLKLGITYYILSLKLDYIGDGNTMINATVTYDLENDFVGSLVLKKFNKLVNYFLMGVVSYLQKKNNA